MSSYLFIAISLYLFISILCSKILRVNRALGNFFWTPREKLLNININIHINNTNNEFIHTCLIFLRRLYRSTVMQKTMKSELAWGQFHHDFKRDFFVWNSFSKLFSTYFWLWNFLATEFWCKKLFVKLDEIHYWGFEFQLSKLTPC